MRSPRLALAVILLVAGAACSGDDDGGADSRPEPTTATTAVRAEAALAAGEVVVASAGPEVALDEPTVQAVVDTARRFVEVTTVGPLVDGSVGAGYDALWDSTVVAAATGPDRPALTDEGVPVATQSPALTVTPVRIDALADTEGIVLFVAASFSVDAQAVTAQGPLAIRRTAELTFAPAPDGTWLVTAYRVQVERDLPDGTTTTDTAAGGETGTTG